MKDQTIPQTPQVVQPDEKQERIRQRAYELFEQRRREDGRDLDDWLNAEAEVIANAKAEAA